MVMKAFLIFISAASSAAQEC